MESHGNKGKNTGSKQELIADEMEEEKNSTSEDSGFTGR